MPIPEALKYWRPDGLIIEGEYTELLRLEGAGRTLRGGARQLDPRASPLRLSHSRSLSERHVAAAHVAPRAGSRKVELGASRDRHRNRLFFAKGIRISAHMGFFSLPNVLYYKAKKVNIRNKGAINENTNLVCGCSNGAGHVFFCGCVAGGFVRRVRHHQSDGCCGLNPTAFNTSRLVLVGCRQRG